MWKINNYFIDIAIIKKIIIITMNLRERGITVGDLLIIIIIIFSTTIIINKYKNQKQSSLNNIKTEIITLKSY